MGLLGTRIFCTQAPLMSSYCIGLWLFGTNEFFRDLLCLSGRQWKGAGGVMGESIISDLISFTKSTKSLSSGPDIYRYSLSSRTERIPQISGRSCRAALHPDYQTRLVPAQHISNNSQQIFSQSTDC